MSNIVNLSDKRTPKAKTPKDEMLELVNQLKELVETDKIQGFTGVGFSVDQKTYAVTGGEFDTVAAIGSLEALKFSIFDSSSKEFGDEP